jgi:hypothetical protein
LKRKPWRVAAFALRGAERSGMIVFILAAMVKTRATGG